MMTDYDEVRTVERRWHEVRRRANALWRARCGEPSVDEAERVEVTRRWANGEALHSSHEVRVAGVRSWGCVHARPWLGWRSVDESDGWITVCHLEDCAAGNGPAHVSEPES